MHELSVMSYLLETVEEEARRAEAAKVLAINVVIGEQASMIDDSLLFYFDMLTADTLAQGAQLNIRRTKMQFYCAQCDSNYPRTGDDFRCPRCHIVGQVTDDGTEFLLESIEIEP